MKMTAVSPPSVGLTTISLSHQGQSTVWDVSSTYARQNSSKDSADIDASKLFEEINAYWASLSQERQLGIWESYAEIRAVFDADYELEAAYDKLRQKIAQLYNYMPPAELAHWLGFHATIHYPATLKDRLDPSENPNRKDRTYLREDYFGLVVLSIALRPMLPIWGEFIAATKKESGNNRKEQRAFGLLYHTNLIRTQEVQRLTDFITSSISSSAAGDKAFTPVLGGMGTAELPDWLLAMTCVRRLAPGEVQGRSPEDNFNLIATVWNFVDSKVQSLDRDFGRRFGGRISEKKQVSGGTDDNNPSVVEMYKMKPDLSNGDIVTLNVYAEQEYLRQQGIDWAAAMRLDSTIPIEKLQLCEDKIRDMRDVDIHPHQTWLIKWIIDPIIPARSVDLLELRPLLHAMAITQATLWHWGFPDLAALVTATPYVTHDDVLVGATDHRGKLPKDMILALQKPYPYHPPTKKGVSPRHTNMAARAIDKMADMLVRSDWIMKCPPELMAETSRIGTSRRLQAPADLKTQLARLVLHPNFGQ